jgi:hypothetical protein
MGDGVFPGSLNDGLMEEFCVSVTKDMWKASSLAKMFSC